jgi:hypothetical protein
MRSIVLLGVASVLGLVGCQEQAPSSNDTGKPSAPSAAPRPSASSAMQAAPSAAAPSAAAPSAAASAPSVTDKPGFHLVAELPYPIAFAPLGSDALLVAGEGLGQVLLSIEGNQLRFRPELAQLDQPAKRTSFVSAIGGAWPDNTWLALSGSSDAGPASSDVYQWSGSRWLKKHEHASGVIDLIPWRGSVALQSTFFSVPVMVAQQLYELSSTGTKNLRASVCSASGGALLAPLSVQEGALSIFGYECGVNGNAPERGSLTIETWSKSGAKSKHRMPLPADWLLPERLVMQPDGPAALFAAQGKEPRRVARFVAGSWQTVTTLPAELSALEAPGTLELWAVVGSELRCWTGREWSVTELPTGALPAKASWKSVWRRGAGDLWLIAGSDDKSWLFNTADGNRITALPTETERSAHAEGMTREPSDCPLPFADLLALRPFQLGEDTAVTLSPAKARTILAAALAKEPNFRELQFVRHSCYGEDCVGAQLSAREDAEALYALLVADARSVPAIERFARSNVRCFAPPTSEPFAVMR